MDMQNLFTIYFKLQAPFYGFHLALFTFSHSKLTSNMSTSLSNIKIFNVNASVVKGEIDYLITP